MSVLVCIPTAGDMNSATAEAAFGICANHRAGASFRTVRSHPIDRCRNMCAEMFLQSPHSHMLFIDSDTVPPTDCLDAMLAMNRPLVSGICPIFVQDSVCLSVARKMGPQTYGFFDDCPPTPFEFDAGGLACCLIAREIFERLDPPWFKFKETADGEQVGEDISFYERCAEIGVRPIALPSVMCSHHDVVDLLPIFQTLRQMQRSAPRLAA